MESKERKFWHWFENNNTKFLVLDQVGEIEKNKLLDELQVRLHEYNKNLFFEIGGFPGEIQELIITAEGNKDYFPDVEKLVNESPVIKNWLVIAFKPPVEGGFTTNYQGIVLSSRDMWFLPMNNKNPELIGIRVCFNEYRPTDRDKFLNVIYKMLDTVLGEKVLSLDLDYIDIGQLPLYPEQQGMIELHELPAYIKWRKSKTIKV